MSRVEHEAFLAQLRGRARLVLTLDANGANPDAVIVT
jgi:hypothetical protein